MIFPFGPAILLAFEGNSQMNARSLNIKTFVIMLFKITKLQIQPSYLIGEGNGNPLQSSCLENPMDGGAWWAAVLVGHEESDTTE